MATDRHYQIFAGQRRRLAGLAYRMTGSVSDTDDILQQAWIRLMGQDIQSIQDPARWLATVVARLCLDHLKSARVRRETYVGSWLPEPILDDHDPGTGAEDRLIAAQDVGIALLLVLDTLTPEMRAAFLLREAFDYSFDEISAATGLSVVNCRQLVSRARRRLADVQPSEIVPPSDTVPIVRAFWTATRRGDMQALLDLFTADIEIHSDGGGKVLAAINVLRGRRRAAGFFVGLARKQPPADPPCPPIHRINGAPGFVSVGTDGVLQTTALAVRGGKVATVWIVRNPEKLAHIARGRLAPGRPHRSIDGLVSRTIH